MQGRTVVIGAGPSGLSAAHILVNHGRKTLIIESRNTPGGIARTERFKGFYFDLGGHRFYTKNQRVLDFWNDYLRSDFLSVDRLSRIHYDGRLFRYPIDLQDVLKKMEWGEGGKILFSFLKSQLGRRGPEDSFEEWVSNRFGARLFKKFFKEYTEKVWGLDCRDISADWASQRIRNLTLFSAVKDAFVPQENVKTLSRTIYYPKRGPGQLWTSVAKKLKKQGAEIRFRASVDEIYVEGGRVQAISYVSGKGRKKCQVENVISTMPLSCLLRALRPIPPKGILAAVSRLSHRSLILVGLILRNAHVFSDQWLYVHSPGVKVGRIQNFKNWSPFMVPDPGFTSLGFEYFCNTMDDFWKKSDAELISIAGQELEQLKLADAKDVVDGVVFREAFAYPVYDQDYTVNVKIIRDYLERISNLQTVGRSAMHRYNNQDHSMLAGFYAAENILGDQHDVWDVNTDRTYYEKPVRRRMTTKEKFWDYDHSIRHS